MQLTVSNIHIFEYRNKHEQNDEKNIVYACCSFIHHQNTDEVDFKFLFLLDTFRLKI